MEPLEQAPLETPATTVATTTETTATDGKPAIERVYGLSVESLAVRVVEDIDGKKAIELLAVYPSIQQAILIPFERGAALGEALLKLTAPQADQSLPERKPQPPEGDEK